MKFIEAEIKDVFIVEQEKLSDQRGFFARTFCINEFADVGIDFHIVQCSVSHNKKRGTLRGLHFQKKPHEEAKIVSCTKGRIYDVVVDLRPESASFKRWVAVELNEDNHRSLYIPKGCAHGFQTLTDDTVVYYQMNEFYHPESAAGIVYNDPSLQIDWPLGKKIVSEKDRGLDALANQ
jgi:dTDP-4-dehydrorhamnose 3,5-epimerase